MTPSASRGLGDALRIVSGNAGELDLVVIDFDHGPHGITLISAIKTCRNRLTVFALTPGGNEHAKFLARAIGATQCLVKPLSCVNAAKAMLACGSKCELAQVARLQRNICHLVRGHRFISPAVSAYD